MKKQRKRPQQKKTAQPQPAPAKKPQTDRRAMLRNGLLLAGLVGAGGFFTASTVMATISEHDLSRVGQGIPTIVQVHDPQCTQCQELQREVRAALKAFEPAELSYAVANLASDTGTAFASQYGAPHVTLLLFDGEGALRGTLNGVRGRDELEATFGRLVAEQN